MSYRLAALAFCLGAVSAAHAAPEADHAAMPAAAAPAAVPVFAPFLAPPDGGQQVLGSPLVEGQPFVVRLEEMPGEIVPPHTHHFDENITVIRGVWYFGVGPKFDRAALHRLPTGSFVFIPRGTPMFGYAPDGATVQIHGIGPWNQHFVGGLYTLTDKADVDGSQGVDASRFHFRVGDRVHTPRGPGRIQEGIVTGELVQYILIGPKRRVFVAQEKDLRK